MKKQIILLVILIAFSLTIFAQTEGVKDSIPPKPKHWSEKTDLIFTLEQNQINNWAAGGYSNFAFGSF